jgi:membrane fusion protein, multidrug efflux system
MPPPGPPPVAVMEVSERNVPIAREWVCTLDGSTNVSIQARVQGYIQKQNYANGSLVKAGELLFEIDPRPFEAAVAQARATLAKAQAQQIETGLTEKRYVTLASTGAVSEADRDQAVQANAAAKANVLAAEAALQQSDLNLTYTRILAPVEGIAGIAVPGIGDLVGPASGNLTSLSTVDPIKAIFQISEQEYLAVARETSASADASVKPRDLFQIELVLADGTVHPHKGKVSVLNRQVDTRTGTIQAEALFPNPANMLRPGFFGRVRVVVRTRPNAILVPQRAVSELQGGYQVAVVGSDSKVTIRPVTVGPQIGKEWLISEGLRAGEHIVVEGLQQLRDGVVVKPRPFAGSAMGPVSADAQTSPGAFSAR